MKMILSHTVIITSLIIVPPNWVGFQHIPQEVWINDDKTFVCPVDINGGESLECSNRYSFYSVFAHTRVWDDDFIGWQGCLLPLLKFA
jgi:hypothetical protein